MLTIVSQTVLTAMDKRSKQCADCRRSLTSDRTSDATSAKMLAKILERNEESEFGRNCTRCMCVICLAAVGQFPYVIPVIDSPLSEELLVS